MAAFMNPGGARADLDAGPVTYEAFTVQPFNNFLTTLDLTGAQLNCLLEQQFVTGLMSSDRRLRWWFYEKVASSGLVDAEITAVTELYRGLATAVLR